MGAERRRGPRASGVRGRTRSPGALPLSYVRHPDARRDSNPRPPPLSARTSNVRPASGRFLRTSRARGTHTREPAAVSWRDDNLAHPSRSVYCVSSAGSRASGGRGYPVRRLAGESPPGVEPVRGSQRTATFRPARAVATGVFANDAMKTKSGLSAALTPLRNSVCGSALGCAVHARHGVCRSCRLPRRAAGDSIAEDVQQVLHVNSSSSVRDRCDVCQASPQRTSCVRTLC